MPCKLLYGRNVFANGIRQHFLRYGGKGPAVLLLTGITSPAVTWGFVSERLAERCDVHAVDARGRGLSESGPELDYGLDALAADLLGLVKALGLKRPRVLGHSMGAHIAMRAATQDRGAFSRLVLVDPPVCGPGRKHYPAPLSWYVDSIRLAQRGIDAEGMRAFCPTWSEEQLQLRAQWLHTCYEPAIVRAYEDFHAIDILPDFARLSVPALLMLGGRGVVGEEVERELKLLRPDIPTKRVDDAGHMIPWDDFDGFFEALGDFLYTDA